MNGENPMYLIGLGTVVALVYVTVLLILKLRRIGKLQAEIYRLQRALDETEEQAKLLVRTDMELNKAQDELDKKITSLYALQKLSRAMTTTLEENQIFKKIELSYLEELGFEKALAFLWNDKEMKFQCHLSKGYSEDENKDITAYLSFNSEAYLNLIKSEKALSTISLSKDDAKKETIKFKFKVLSFILSPVLSKEGSQGLIFVGTENKDAPVSAGDEELVTILANQLGQALENARLFEKTWRAQQDLEKRVEERTRDLTLALEEVKKISQRKTEFVSSVSHELRTPLTSIKGYAAILLAGKLGELPEEIRVRLDKINRHTDELVQFVNDLLDISRIEAGKTTMKQSSEELKKIIDEVSDLLSTQLKDKQIELSCDIADDAGVVFVDAGQIKRVLINLINNAIKFSPPKGKITVKTHKADKQVQIDVSDNGCGIPEHAQESIFEEFYRVDNPVNQQLRGSGLGLTLVKNIIEAHKGKIWVKSQAGIGSTFSFTLPQ